MEAVTKNRHKFRGILCSTGIQLTSQPKISIQASLNINTHFLHVRDENPSIF